MFRPHRVAAVLGAWVLTFFISGAVAQVGAETPPRGGASKPVIATAPASAPATGAATRHGEPEQDVPSQTLDEIEAQFALPDEKPASQAEAIKILTDRMEKVLVLGQAAEAWYPHATNLHAVRNAMLSAALQLASLDPTPQRQEQVVKIAQRIVDSSAPAAEKLQADFFLIRDKVLQAARTPPADPSRPDLTADIRAFLSRYEDTPAVARAVAYGVILADGAMLVALKEELLDRLEKDFGHVEELAPFLQHYGRGRFSAKLTRLDGTELTVPNDVKAKVIVIDFWATWCGPCVAEAPQMKKIYEQFRNRGVEFVGISLDEDPGAKERVEKFVKEHGLDWIHTLSGKGWADATARQYVVNAIPAVWVIDGSGKIVSSDAQADLEKILEDTLTHTSTSTPANPTTQPAR